MEKEQGENNDHNDPHNDLTHNDHRKLPPFFCGTV